MSKTVVITLTVECVYSQQITVSDILYGRLMLDADMNDVSEIENGEGNILYQEIESLIDWKDILSKGDFEDISISEVQRNEQHGDQEQKPEIIDNADTKYNTKDRYLAFKETADKYFGGLDKAITDYIEELELNNNRQG